MKLRKPVATLLVALNLGQVFSPLLANADPLSGASSAENAPVNPFSQIRLPHAATASNPVAPVRGANTTPATARAALPPGTSVAQKPSQTDDSLTCPSPELTVFERLIEDFIAAHGAEDPIAIHIAHQIALSVFEQPGSGDYVQKLQTIDRISARAPNAMYDIARDLQNRWEADYGMEIHERLELGVPSSTPSNPTTSQARAERLRLGETTGATVGAFVAFVALGFAAIKNPTAIPRYNAAFRALLPALGATAGLAAGRQIVNSSRTAAMFKRNIPLAPAHIMHLGVESDDFNQSDESVARGVLPYILGIGATGAMYALVEKETAGTAIYESLLNAIRVIRGINAAATPVKFNPAVFVSSLLVSVLVEQAALDQINKYEFRSLKAEALAARDTIDQGIAKNDNVMINRGAQALVNKTHHLQAFLNRPLLQANKRYGEDLEEAQKKYPIGSKALAEAVNELAISFSTEIQTILQGADQSADADYQAYLALETLEHQEWSALAELPELARDRTNAYLDAFQGYSKGFEAYLSRLEETQKQNLGTAASSAAYNEYFAQYVRGMRNAKDQQLAKSLRAGNLPHHAGHILLQASALLRTTDREYVQAQADSLKAEVTRGEFLTRSLLRVADSNAAAEDPNAQTGNSMTERMGTF